ncbi:hypothetical protein GCM10029992_23350 [Glycomyces albus]
MDPVGADEDVGVRGGPVLEHGGHPSGLLARLDQAPAVLEADAVGVGPLVQDPVQLGAVDQLQRLDAGQRRDLDPPAADDHPLPPQRHGHVADRRGRADEFERGDAVGRQREGSSGALGPARIGLVDGRVDAGAAQGHGGDGAGDAAADDGGGLDVLRHCSLPVVIGGANRRGESGPGYPRSGASGRVRALW